MIATNNVVPERVLLQIVRDGIAAITTDLATAAVGESVLDHILAVLDTDERAKARAVWTANVPSAIMGFARTDTPFPCFALTMASDDIQQDYVGVAEQMLLDDFDAKLGNLYRRRLRGSFSFWIYAEHPDVVSYWYRVLRRILNAAIPRMLKSGLQDPTMTGADLMPSPQFQPDNLFNRRLTITVEYEEDWSDTDPLWEALNGAPEGFITDAEQVSVHHVDQAKIPGKVRPYEED